MRDEDAKINEVEKTVDSKYIQQHLANERTFLAWVRTAIAIIGVGFLVTNLHFNMQASLTPIGNFMANLIGISSVALGIIVIVMSMAAYLRKVQSINDQTFRTPRLSIILLGILVVVITAFFGVYFVMVNM
ncbi:YidH family protein [Neobacillus sp. SCS-31]|uniref:YidH family protein n=1 Tax=Neobacillus oceani TaxID=3115292 RepID=UPI0039059A50